jgi:hypothetical protein
MFSGPPRAPPCGDPPAPRRGAACSSSGWPARRTLAGCPPRAGGSNGRGTRWTSASPPPPPGAGKWANLNAALADHPPDGHDWLLLVDDDVVLPRGFLDRFLLLAERSGFRLAQPAHRFDSHAAWRVTRRRPGVLARRTRFVEIGPVTAIHADAFGSLLPFPDLHMGWGLDAHWSAVAERHGWAVGVVDATPIRHVRPVASGYPRAAALAEADAFLAQRPYVPRDRALETLATYRRLR